MEFVLLKINLFSSLFLCGLIWTIQLVHYPLFKRLERDNFQSHIHFHGLRISLIVIPVMTAELITSTWLTWISDSEQLIHGIGLIMVLMIWVITFTVQVPLHSQLGKGFDPDSIQKLIRSNWIRTVLWSAKALLTVGLLSS